MDFEHAIYIPKRKTEISDRARRKGVLESEETKTGKMKVELKNGGLNYGQRT